MRRLLVISWAVLTVGSACGSGSVDGDAGIDARQDRDAGADAGVRCDPVTQQGCNAGQKCSIVPGRMQGDPSSVGCVADTGSGQLMSSCTPATSDTPDGCAKGLVCRGGSDPRCVEFCQSSPSDTCSGEQLCAFGLDLDGDQLDDVELCAQTCDVLDQGCVQSSHACYPSVSGAICALEGAGGVPAAEGEPCPYANSCAEGLGCFRIGLSEDWLCFKLCDPADGIPGCNPGTSCSPVQNETWGICTSF